MDNDSQQSGRRLRTGCGELDVLVRVVQAWPDERAHGAIYHDEVLVAVGLRARHRIYQRGRVGHHGASLPSTWRRSFEEELKP